MSPLMGAPVTINAPLTCRYQVHHTGPTNPYPRLAQWLVWFIGADAAYTSVCDEHLLADLRATPPVEHFRPIAYDHSVNPALWEGHQRWSQPSAEVTTPSPVEAWEQSLRANLDHPIYSPPPAESKRLFRLLLTELDRLRGTSTESTS